jgi:Arc/MetJ-type ribon-helix-helix transcriptional regulator
MTKISNFRIPESLKIDMKEAVKRGSAANLSDLIRKAVREYLQNHPPEPLDILRESFQGGDVDS